MKKYAHILLSAAVMVALSLFTACTQDTPDDPEENTPVIPTPTPTPDTPSDTPQPGLTPEWEVPEFTVLDTHVYTQSELIDRAIGAYGSMIDERTLNTLKGVFGLLSSSAYTYHEAILKYRSIDHKGEPIYLSGIVSYKTRRSYPLEVEQIVIDSHATITDNASCPSEGGSILQMAMIKNPIVIIAADYQGYGVSRADMHPYLNEELTASQQVDLVKAAIAYLSSGEIVARFDDNVETYSVGYSQGGAVALATQRKLERDEPKLASAIGLRGSVCGDGPYNLINTLVAYQRQGFVSFPVILPMIVRSMMECYPELFTGLTLRDFFTDDFLNAGGGIMALIDQKELNTLQFGALLGSNDPLSARFSLESILKPEALAAGSPQLNAMLAAFSRNNCILGWTPAKPVCFFHSKDDTVVSYDNLLDAETWPSGSYTIVNPGRDGVDHFEGAILFYTDLLLKGPAKFLADITFNAPAPNASRWNAE